MRECMAAGVLAVLCCATGCGYGGGKLFRTDIRTVHVAMFETHEFRRNLEFMLTEAVKKRIATDTPYRVASAGNADTILSGEVLEVRQAALAPAFETRLPRDKQMTLVVRVEWKDLLSGKVLVEQPLLLEGIDYLPPAGESEPFAEQKVIERMAARIVSKLYDEW